MARIAQFAAVVGGLVAIAGAAPKPPRSLDCRCFPDESCWPSTHVWSELDAEVGGKLVATVPLGSPCHEGDDYDEEYCEYLQDNWKYEEIHMESSSSVMAPFFANQSCDPFQPKDTPCELGNYVRYAVNATTPDDIISTIKFAAIHNIRLVIRNTGHDYNGRSTGAGSLAVWTHYMKDIEILDFEDEFYSGKAMKAGAGVQGFEVMQAGYDAGLVVVAGECPTVSIAGGYTQGGGHSALSTSFGLSADNVLEWEVVTTSGKLVTASRTENEDLYWALSGGGAGNYGIVTSLTTKAHPDGHFGGATLAFYPGDDNDEDTFYDAIDAFHEELPGMVDAGALVIYYFGSAFFQIAPLNAYEKTAAEVEEMMAPFIARLEALSVVYTVEYTEHDSYLDHYDLFFGPLPLGNIEVGIAQYGGRLIPRANIADMGATARSIASKGVTWIGVATDVSSFGGSEQNSVLPAWRDALVHVTLTTPWSFEAEWEEMIALQDLMTCEIMPEIEAATPGSGAYMNEADFRQAEWQDNFYGSNYEALEAIKQKWDCSDLLYVWTGVGSEDWEVQSNGQLCKVR